jgi:hypothetical protein
MNQTDTSTREFIRDTIRDGIAKNKGVNWLGGVPLGWFAPQTLQAMPTLRKMVDEGELEIVSRPRATDPAKTVSYVRFTKVG